MHIFIFDKDKIVNKKFLYTQIERIKYIYFMYNLIK